jgi:putative ABC transport system permease protein
MTFLRLIAQNIASRRLRSALTAAAVGIGVMSIVALGILTTSLKTTATEVLRIGNADFTISQKHTDDIVNSSISQADIASINKVPGVQQAIGALIEVDKYDAANPVVIQVGLDPAAQAPFGVKLLEGRSYAADSKTDVMLGYELAQRLHKHVGDSIAFDSITYHVVGLYATNVSFGNSTVMFPLPTLQGENRVSGQISLGFVKVRPGVSIARVRAAIDSQYPQLTTIQSAADYGRADRNLTLIEAANTGGSILAALIAITGVLNTSLLSFFERIREFGIMRSIGWSRARVLSLVLGETLIVSLTGAVIGLFGGWVAVNLLQHLSQLRGIFQPTYDAWVFGRSLLFAVVVAFVGALYPALRAALLVPMEALRRE